MKIALCQVASSTTSVEANIATVKDAAAKLAASPCDVLVFPEAMALSFGGDLPKAAEQWNSWVEGLRCAAAVAHTLIIAGGFRPAEHGDRRVRNTLCCVTEHGLVRAYDKIHGFDALGYCERDTVQPGRTVPEPYEGIGFAVCHDLRFPSMFIEQASAGAGVLVASASWGAGAGKATQWEALAQVRAMDSCSFLVAVDQADRTAMGDPGMPDQPQGIGMSGIWAPDGSCLMRLGRAEEVGIVDVPVDEVSAYRSRLGVLHNRVKGIDYDACGR